MCNKNILIWKRWSEWALCTAGNSTPLHELAYSILSYALVSKLIFKMVQRNPAYSILTSKPSEILFGLLYSIHLLSIFSALT